MKTRLHELVDEFLMLLSITETSDSGTDFKPNRISSCRVLDGIRMNTLLAEMKDIVSNDN